MSYVQPELVLKLLKVLDAAQATAVHNLGHDHALKAAFYCMKRHKNLYRSSEKEAKNASKKYLSAGMCAVLTNSINELEARLHGKLS